MICLQRLGTGEWFTTRVSACALIAPAYKGASSARKTELRQLFCNLGKDETPMVRRAIAQRFGDLAGVVEASCVIPEIIPTFLELTQDGKFTNLSMQYLWLQWRLNWTDLTSKLFYVLVAASLRLITQSQSVFAWPYSMTSFKRSSI